MSSSHVSRIHPFLQASKRIPATILLIIINVSVYAIAVIQAGSSEGAKWTLTLLRMGAQFNPLTLDGEWHRIFTHMFLHGNFIHLAVNMYALFSVGREIEIVVGAKKFLPVYFVSGIAAALNSLYWSLFTIGVGASGAIFGLFGFSLVINIFFSRTSGKPITPILVNFLVFLGVNLMIAETVNADNAAHFGGLGAGVMIGLFAMATGGGEAFRKARIEYAMTGLLLVIYFILPRFQVRYYQFFQHVVAAEDSVKARLSRPLTDERYLEMFTKNIRQWDSALAMLDSLSFLPPQLAQDTFNLRRYIGLRKQENVFRKMMVERESYIYLDSVAEAQKLIPEYLGLKYGLSFSAAAERSAPGGTVPTQQVVKIWYDKDWIEIPSPPAAFYRIGFRDSLRRWDGLVQDFYANGDIQMKGTYKQNKRDGVFLYYSDHHTYTSAGRYREDQSVGKWETYHNNGVLASEVYYNNGYFLKNLWDSLGNQLVIDGNGKEIQRHPNGIVAMEGEFRNGRKEGYWYGRHSNGQLYFEENFNGGRLISGRSRTLAGEIFVYDASSLFPMPSGGFQKFREYVSAEARRFQPEVAGRVRLSFRVTRNQVLTDLIVESSASPQLDERAKEILLKGPAWLPARRHGHEAVDGFGYVVVDFE